MSYRFYRRGWILGEKNDIFRLSLVDAQKLLQKWLVKTKILVPLITYTRVDAMLRINERFASTAMHCFWSNSFRDNQQQFFVVYSFGANSSPLFTCTHSIHSTPSFGSSLVNVLLSLYCASKIRRPVLNSSNTVRLVSSVPNRNRNLFRLCQCEIMEPMQLLCVFCVDTYFEDAKNVDNTKYCRVWCRSSTRNVQNIVDTIGNQLPVCLTTKVNN